ncbi:hypothetical protein MANI_024032 [Metarhizium anisopliae]|nr:hypothetical protein MANI_024032 [Metarhizium anisopliae]
MKLFSTSLVAVSVLAGFSYAWDVTSYRYISDCRVHDDGAYRYYEGSDSKTCHNLAGGDSGASCTQYTNGGDHHANCDGNMVVPGSIYVGGDTRCAFFTDTNCRGTRREGSNRQLGPLTGAEHLTADSYTPRLKLGTKQVDSGIYKLWEAED